MLIELVYHVVLWLNAFPAKSGVSETLSPREIVYRHKLDFAKHCKSPFGTYCKVHDEPTPTNTMVTCSTPATVLGSTGNLQGTYKFFSLAMRKKVKWCAFMPHPMPDSVIKKVKASFPGIRIVSRKVTRTKTKTTILINYGSKKITISISSARKGAIDIKTAVNESGKTSKQTLSFTSQSSASNIVKDSFAKIFCFDENFAFFCISWLKQKIRNIVYLKFSLGCIMAGWI